jgi:hypothetical protein
MPTAPLVAIIRHSNVEAPFDAERQQGFRWHANDAATGDDLSSRARGGSGGCPNGRALAAASDGSNDGAEQRSAADVFTGPAIRSDTLATG